MFSDNDHCFTVVLEKTQVHLEILRIASLIKWHSAHQELEGLSRIFYRQYIRCPWDYVVWGLRNNRKCPCEYGTPHPQQGSWCDPLDFWSVGIKTNTVALTPSRINRPSKYQIIGFDGPRELLFHTRGPKDLKNDTGLVKFPKCQVPAYPPKRDMSDWIR